MGAYMPLNGVPASGNAWLLTEVLRDTWGFKGFVSSDSGAVSSLVTQGFAADRSEEHTSELQSLMRISYAVFCLKKKKVKKPLNTHHHLVLQLVSSHALRVKQQQI